MSQNKPKLTPLEKFTLPEDRKELIKKASKLEIVTIVFMMSVVVLMYLAAGQSQSMKTALLEDVLSIIPPIAFLWGHKISDRDPDHWFPYGYRRSTLIGYLAASVALVVLGLFSLYESGAALVHGTRPSLGLTSLFGYRIWEGWLMVAALAYSVVPIVFLGRAKKNLAEKLGDHTLQADSATNRADWLTGLAAAVGIIGIGLGWWWSDATMALLISVDIVRDGSVYLRNAVGGLMDRAPSEVSDLSAPHSSIEKLRDFVETDLGLTIVELRIRSIGLFQTGYLSVKSTKKFEEEELSDLLGDHFPTLHDLNVAYRDEGSEAS